MNKADLADRNATEQWSAFFKKKGYYVVSLDARSKNGMKSITDIIMEACKEKMERDRKRGIKNRPVRAMVVGIPNVGKSTFINSYAGKACAKTGNKPGVTKGKQWIRLSKSVELLDTPGILWPKFEDQKVGLRLELSGCIRDEILNTEKLRWSGQRSRKMAEKIDAIKEELTATPTEALEAFVEKYASDSRTGVQKLVDTAKKRMDKLQKEMIRTENLKKYEKEYDTYTYICGIDEVGRGPLAGPVVAGAVILPKDCDILYINDSKKLSAAKREELYDIIMEQAVATGLGTIGPDRIDEINILQATYEAMRQAIAQLSPQPDLLLNDAVTIPKVTIPQVPIIKGDAKSISIGAASIIAKVTRDRMMVYYDSIYPEYGFASNKGYGSAEHIAALKAYGPTPIHRRTFIKNFVS